MKFYNVAIDSKENLKLLVELCLSIRVEITAPVLKEYNRNELNIDQYNYVDFVDDCGVLRMNQRRTQRDFNYEVISFFDLIEIASSNVISPIATNLASFESIVRFPDFSLLQF